MPQIALVAYIVYLLLVFGLRGWIHYRRTGSSGFVGISGSLGSAEWFGGALFVLALIAGAAAPLLQIAGWVVPAAAVATPAWHAAGGALFAIGVAGTLWAQFAMGDSWRIGVDLGERTRLVASGPFRWVRNPIFTCMAVAAFGLALLIPNVLSFGALVLLVSAIEIQVRLVEEPYLAAAQGAPYTVWAARTGRFVPGVGRRRHDRAGMQRGTGAG